MSNAGRNERINSVWEDHSIGSRAVLELFRLRSGDLPLLISVPHAGTFVPEDLCTEFTDRAQTLPDTDWFVDRLVDLPDVSAASLLVANTSRYVIDLNRPPSGESLYPGQATTGLCPTITFAGEPLYRADRTPTAAEIDRRIQTYWQPYHLALQRELARIRQAHGFALLFDAHSIASRVPRLFDGQLPDLNYGTNHGRSCGANLQTSIERFAQRDTYFSNVVNGRFVGGYITRQYGAPDQNVYSLQLEMSQATYLDEPTRTWASDKAPRLQDRLAELFAVLLDWRPTASASDD